jgi:hypothetical protein
MSPNARPESCAVSAWNSRKPSEMIDNIDLT